MPTNGYKIFANIPFNLSASVVRKFAFSNHPPKSMYLIAQKQFARKLVQSDQHFNSLLGAELWPWYTVRIRKPLRKTDFTPPPAVDTVLIEIKPLETPLIDVAKRRAYHDFVTKCFSLQKYFQSLNREKAGVSAERKPSELTTIEWVRLFESR